MKSPVTDAVLDTKSLPTGGGLKAVRYVLGLAAEAGPRRLAEAVRSKNTCKACAFGTGGQRGGLHNEHSHGIEICNKNLQAQSGDLRPAIPRALFEQTSLQDLATLSGRELEALGRLAHPLYKAPGADRYQVISHDEAITRISERLQGTDPQRSFFYASGRSSNEAAFLLQLFARVFGSNHVNNCSYYCHQASGVGLQAAIGTGTASVQFQDLPLADTFFVIGANPASNHPRFLKVLIECRRRGGQVIVINPAREPGLLRFASPSHLHSMIVGGAPVASLYVQPHVGGDLALLQGIAKAVLENGGEDARFIAEHCAGFAEYADHLRALDWSRLCEESGVEPAQLQQLAQLYQRSHACVFAWGMGVTHHRHGVENIEAISNLALLRGMLGAPGKGLLPLRGHSNVQGVGSMGVTPALKQQVFERLETSLGIRLPQTAGMDTLACLRAAQEGRIDAAVLLGGNLYAASPDSQFAARALAAIPFRVQFSSTLNLGHVHGLGEECLVLPIRVRDEETQPTTQESMFNYVRLSDGGFERIEGLCSEVELLSRIAERVIPRDILDFSAFAAHRSIRQAIARVIPGYAALGEIDDTRQEFHVGERHLEQPRFATADGRAHFLRPTAQAARPVLGDREFMLSTVRSEGQFNTIVYSDKDTYRRQSERQIVMMHPADMRAAGLQEDQRVTLTSSAGRLAGLKVKPFDIRRGNLLMYFPEANVLVPLHTDPRSQTPGFKAVPVRLTAD